jgi:hypothetical protein
VTADQAGQGVRWTTERGADGLVLIAAVPAASMLIFYAFSG